MKRKMMCCVVVLGMLAVGAQAAFYGNVLTQTTTDPTIAGNWSYCYDTGGAPRMNYGTFYGDWGATTTWIRYKTAAGYEFGDSVSARHDNWSRTQPWMNLDIWLYRPDGTKLATNVSRYAADGITVIPGSSGTGVVITKQFLGTYPSGSNTVYMNRYTWDISSFQDVGMVQYRLTYAGSGNPFDSRITEMKMEVVPEPATMILMSLGSLALLRRRK